MGNIDIPTCKAYRRRMVVVSLALAILSTLIGVQMLAAAQGQVTAGDLTGSSKTVDSSQGAAGDTLQYTVVVSNSGNTSTNFTMTDRLPISVTLVNLSAPTGSLFMSSGPVEQNGIITMTGSLSATGFVSLDFTAQITDAVSPGQHITNSVAITGTGVLITKSVGTLVVSQPPTQTTYLPLLAKPLPTLSLSSSRPDSGNHWTLSWNAGGPGVTGYELYESQDSGFVNFTAFNLLAPSTSQAFTHTVSFKNAYYYRVRATAGSIVGPWSNIVLVAGAYRDDFNDSNSGWGVRRMSYDQAAEVRYGTGTEAGNLIILTKDRWDWMIASPLMPAPTIPYAIEYRSRVHDWSNLVSGGGVFGGDWNGAPCPDPSNPYANNHCFNHFYNTNTIWYGPLKMLFERVDYLFYCPNCGGSQLKRLTNNPGVWFTVGVPNVDPFGYNTWRIEVRSSGIRWYANGQFFAQTTDSTWVNEPYFGVFSSTDEYKPSIWFFDYYQVYPLDS